MHFPILHLSYGMKVGFSLFCKLQLFKKMSVDTILCHTRKGCESLGAYKAYGFMEDAEKLQTGVTLRNRYFVS